MSEWFELPWPCGHNDPVYKGRAAQECAICGMVRTDPNAERKPLTCAMGNCSYDVTHVDGSGFVYCAHHGVLRRLHEKCRKLRPWEKSKLERGITINY